MGLLAYSTIYNPLFEDAGDRPCAIWVLESLILRSSPEQGGVKRNSTLDFKRLTLTDRQTSVILAIPTNKRNLKMLNKQNHENIKWELMDMSTKNMHRYLKESTIEKVLEVLDSEITFDELQDYAFDTRGE